MVTKSIKIFDKEWSAEDWVQWVFILGHKLDSWIPWSGVDNRERIEQAIDEWLKLKRVA